jgi:glycosyltransferase involved in cell wall biosynthesis
MRIGIDISQVIYGTGVSVYTKNLITSLFSLDKQNEYLLFGSSLRRRNELVKFTNSLIGKFDKKLFFIPPTLSNIIWNRLHILPIEFFCGRLDIFHSSNWTQPPSGAFKVTTIHDLTPLRFPKLTNPKLVSQTKNHLKWVEKEVDRIIVPSQATKQDLLLLKFDKKKIRVIPEAPDPAFRRDSIKKILQTKEKYNTEKFLLAVGANRRKNIQRVISAYELARPGKDLKLVVVGQKWESYKETRGVVFTGHIKTGELVSLYSAAEALVYPSLYEGFGLPILEAFACGCPVVTSSVSSMPEVGGKAAVYVDPYDTSSIAEGIQTALRRKISLVKKGRERLKAFSWQKTAQETLGIYLEASKR